MAKFRLPVVKGQKINLAVDWTGNTNPVPSSADHCYVGPDPKGKVDKWSPRKIPPHLSPNGTSLVIHVTVGELHVHGVHLDETSVITILTTDDGGNTTSSSTFEIVEIGTDPCTEDQNERADVYE